MKPLRHALLNAILSQPTAPFREGRVIAATQNKLALSQVPHFLDPCGNLIIGADSKAAYLRLLQTRSNEPVRVFIAHMDHPGFHGIRFEAKGEMRIQWHGGSPTQHLEGALVWLAHQNGWTGSGKLKSPQLLDSGKALNTALVEFDSSWSHSHSHSIPLDKWDAKSYFGGFQFRASHWQEGELLYTQAADDLVGCFSIVSTALDLWKKSKPPRSRTSSQSEQRPKSPPPFLGILTRAEEVGFIGAISHFELGWLRSARRPVVCISLETSRTLPGAEIGKGPIVRLGDRFTIFNPNYTKILTDLAQVTLPGCHQRRVMDGGTCEATAALVYGYPCIGISVPLGNYHNQSLEGGPDSAPPNGPAPEFVHLQDVAGLLKLCHALLKPGLNWSDPWKQKMQDLKKSVRHYLPLLRSGP